MRLSARVAARTSLLVALTMCLQLANPALSSAPAAAAATTVGLWHLDSATAGVTPDDSGNRRDGTLVGGPTFAPGRFGNALTFNGATQYVDLGTPAMLNGSDAFTLEAWIKLGAGYTTTERAIIYAFDATQQSKYWLQMVAGTGALRCGRPDRYTDSPGPLPVDTWVHVACTDDGQVLRIYRDGTQVATRSHSLQTISDATANVSIGSLFGTNQFFLGAIDEVRVLNGALSAAEVAARASQAESAGSLSFRAAVGISIADGPAFVTSGDVNGDGKPDLVTANYLTNTFSVLLGDGAGGISSTTTLPSGASLTGPGGANSVAIADLNADGKQDLAIAVLNAHGVVVRLGRGDGTFGSAVLFPMGGPYSQTISVAIGDVNADGKPDLVSANLNASNVSVRLGDGIGGFAAATNFVVGYLPTQIAIGDLNGDGKLDLVTTVHGTASVAVLLGTGGGAFAPATGYGAGTAAVAIGDLNGDGKLDLVTAKHVANAVSVRLGNGAGGFSAETQHAAGTSPVSVALADLDGDGSLDVVVANSDPNRSASVLLGNGRGGLGSPTNFLGSWLPPSGGARGEVWVTIDDLNGDGKPDLALASLASDSVAILLNATRSADTTPPAAPIVDLQPYVRASTRFNQPVVISGEAGATVSGSITSSGGSGSVALSGTIAASGSSTFTLDLSPLPDGTLSAAVRLTDAAGNVSAIGSDTAVKDTVAPAVPSAPDLPASADTGTSQTDNVTSGVVLSGVFFTPYVTLNVTADPGVHVYLHQLGHSGYITIFRETTTPGSYTVTAGLEEGLWQLVAWATDDAGNGAGPSAVLPLLVDDTKPSASVRPLPAATGPDAFDVTVQYSDPVPYDLGQHGLLNYAPLPAGVISVELFVKQPGASAFVSSGAQSFTASSGGTRTFTYAPNAGGQYEFYAVATDLAGNVQPRAAGAQASTTFTYDTTPPVIVVPTSVVADATSGNGAVVNYAASATDDSGTVASFGCSPASGTAFPVGDTTVTCTASDPSGNTSSATFIVHVNSAAEQISNTVSAITASTLPNGQKSSLLASLDAAQSSLARGDVATACNQLSAFINKTSAQSGKAIAAALASQLIDAARRERVVLGCT